jgi:hypothetical protein
MGAFQYPCPMTDPAKSSCAAIRPFRLHPALQATGGHSIQFEKYVNRIHRHARGASGWGRTGEEKMAERAGFEPAVHL